MTAPTCISCERTGQVLSGRWQYQPHGNPKAMIFPVCGRCMVGLLNSAKARQKLAEKIEYLMPDFVVIEDGLAVMLILGPNEPSGRAA